MTTFALQVDTADGVEHHVLGNDPDCLAAAEDMRDNWRSQPPNAFYLLKGPAGGARVYVRDITDVRVTIGGGR